MPVQSKNLTKHVKNDMIGALIQQYIMKSVIYKPFIIFSLLAVSAGLFGDFTVAYATSTVPAPTVVFVANPTTIRRGESAALSWTSTNTDYCVASGGWSEWVFSGGAENVYPKVKIGKSTRLNSSHSQISYAAFCLKKN